MNQASKNILIELFKASIEPSEAAVAIVFRAKQHEHIDLIEQLESKRFIERRDERYYVQLSSLLEIEGVNEVDELLSLCEKIFQYLRCYYLENPGKNILLNTLAESTNTSRAHLDKALSYMVQTHIFGGYTTKFHEVVDAYVLPSEPILRAKIFKDAIYRISDTTENPFLGEPRYVYDVNSYTIDNSSFINALRIDAIKNLQSIDFDFSRLIRICEEINSNYKQKNYIATSILLRVLIDHVPPLLGFKTFKEVASSYPGKSFKGTFLHLENGCRSISDGLMHQTIRRKESLPTINQVNYSADVDVLLGEIIRKFAELNITQPQ